VASESEIIENAIELIEKEGWTQGVGYCPETGGRCIRGAMHRHNKSDWEDHIHDRMVFSAEEEIAKDIDAMNTVVNYASVIVKFNDSAYTTKEMVLRKMTETAKRLRNEGR
jgi:hypothetical protein